MIFGELLTVSLENRWFRMRIRGHNCLVLWDLDKPDEAFDHAHTGMYLDELERHHIVGPLR